MPMKLGHDSQCVENEQIDDAEGTPEFAKALEDEERVADTSHGT